MGHFFKPVIALIILCSTLNINTAKAQVDVGDSLALVALYNATDGPNWTNNTNWLIGTADTWFGVTVTGNRVTSLSFGIADNNLIGSIPVELGSLASLTELIMPNTQLSGPIPAELGNLISLNRLWLYNNQLSSSIPVELGNLSSLNELNLGGNQLTGSIPIELGNLASLAILILSDNQLTGSIPVELGSLATLSYLRLSSNQLSGPIPAELGNLISLNTLWLYNNQLVGSIPVELGNLSSLNDLQLSINQLTGPIPIELGNLASLAILLLSNNQLTGAIPVELSSLTSLTNLLLDGNQFDSMANLSSLVSLTFTNVSSNDLTFDDIEANNSISGTFIYSPQNIVGVARFFPRNPGDTITLSIPVGGSANQYQWQKDGVDISGATNDFLVLADLDSTDIGTYKLLITNAIVTGLSLESAEMLVNVAGATPSDYYWVGDGGVWTDVSHWSSTSGGVADKIAFPGKLDDVFFDANSFSTTAQVVSIPDNGNFLGVVFKTIDWTGVTNNPTFQIVASTSDWIENQVYGSLIFDPNMTLDFNGAEFHFYSDTDYFIDTKGLYLGDLCWLYINAPKPDGGGASDVVCNVLSDINPAGLALNRGTFRLNGHSLYEKDSYVWVFRDSVTFDVTGSYLDVSVLSLPESAIGATIIDDNATIKVSTLLRANGVDFNHVILSDSVEVGLYSHSFDTLEIAPGANIILESEITQNVGELIMQGTELLPISISATKPDTAAIISKATGRVDASHVSFRDNTAIGGAVFNAYSSFDLGNTTGWNFRNNSAQDSLALLNLFNATGGPSWGNSSNWNTAEPFSTWYGVAVNDSGRVSKINLAFNNLSGTIPAEIGDLPELTYLWLGRNDNLLGQVPPEIGQLSQLDTLGFSYSGLSGTIPESLYNLTNLIRFSMSNTQVSGTLSPSVANLTNLKHIALWNTPLSGDIPNEFWDMTQLERIYLGTNELGGEISPKIGEFTNLEDFWISGSNLSGEIPPELGDASTTTLVNLFDNKLTGKVPDEIINLSELKTFNIQNNELNYLPDLTELDSLQALNISNNKFTYGDILPNQSLITENTGQKPFGDSIQVQAYTFEGLRLDPGLEIIEGQQYQWYKDNVALSDGTGLYYFIDDFREGDGGVFYLEVTHPDVDSLILTRNPMVVSENKGDPPKPGAVEVISPNGDGINDEMIIKNIELYPQHRVLIYDVLGRLVYYTTEYDNINNPFIGIGNQDGFNELPSGTYYYLIDVGDTKKNGTGFFVMKRR